LSELPAIIKERLTFSHLTGLHFGNEDRVVAGLAVLHELTFEVRHRIVE
jgi:hypothetical protein